jgi:transposase-like protein
MRSNDVIRQPNRTYTAAEKAAAVGLALAVGPLKAAEQLGIPPRTVAAWSSGERGIQPRSAASQPEIIEKLRTTFDLAIEAVIEGLNDPKSRLSDRAHALDVLGRHYALLSGGVTSRTETTEGLSLTESELLAEWIERQIARQADPAAIAAALPYALEAVVSSLPSDDVPELLPGPIEGEASDV